jgi:hypothetical protein
MSNLRITLLGTSLLLSIVVLAAAAIASEAPMRITDVRFTDLNDPTQIEIVGTQFDNGGAPVVTLDGDPITVNGSAATLIQAEIPAGTSNGEHTIEVITGEGTKQNAAHLFTVAPVESMNVSCVDWFITGGHGEHIHNELHVEDDSGNAVLGANVVYTTAFRTFDERDAGVAPRVFQTNATATSNTAGHNHGEGCSEPSGSGVTGWFCCIGAGKHDADQEIPGKKSCPIGEYTYDILSVTSPEGTPLVWDGAIPGPLSVDFVY